MLVDAIVGLIVGAICVAGFMLVQKMMPKNMPS
jgi:hypothetical protein